MVVCQGLRLAGAGLVLGIGVALVLAGSIAPLLFEVTPHDGGVLAAAALALIVVAILATWLPARRATRVDPVSALRVE
jgi:ABC-type antimicrobial peptide transport system permease subunit